MQDRDLMVTPAVPNPASTWLLESSALISRWFSQLFSYDLERGANSTVCALFERHWEWWCMRGLRAAVGAGAALLLAGCATAPDPSGANDPYEHFNRQVFDFNVSVDRAVLKAAAQAY